TRVFQHNSSNNFNLSGNLSFLENEKLLRLNHSNFTLLNKTWDISPNNKIFFTSKAFKFENFVVANRNQSISLNGTISNNAHDLAELKVFNFELGNLNGLLSGNKIGGIVDGNIYIKDLYKDLDLEGKIKVDQFTVDGFLIGDINGKSSWDNHKKQLNIDVDVE